VAFIRRIVVLDSTRSTNDDVRRLASTGAPEGTVVVAEQQSAGRGRLGRTWESPERLGLYLSVLLRPVDPPDRVGRYSLAAAVAVCEACRGFVDDRVVLKWPNDVLADGRKLAGVLAETRQGASGAELVLGAGVNIGQRVSDFGAALAGSATSLRLLRRGEAVDREAVAVAVIGALGETFALIRAGGWQEVAGRFLRYAPHASGARVRLAHGRVGTTNGLDDSGALRVQTADGIVLAHASESVSLAEE
jgi:BirA family biotin operon repressor/biotin-[acetyl-CoA-carboxylase] ligase